MTVTQPQITSLLTNRDLDRLARLRLNGSRRFTNRARGEHLAAKGGTSTEFCDYRDYAPGDDMRFVDWNIFARIERPYIKQFHQEEERHVVLIVDASASMRFEGKSALALRLAAALGAVGLNGGEKVSAYAIGNSGSPPCLSPVRGRPALARLFRFLEGVRSGGDSPVENGIEAVVRQHTGRGVAIVLSDFLTAGNLKRAFNLLRSSSLEVFAVQILAPGEIDPDVSGDLRLVDCETLGDLDISSASDLLSLYQEYRSAHEEFLNGLCRLHSGRFISISAADSLDRVLFEAMRRKGWLV